MCSLALIFTLGERDTVEEREQVLGTGRNWKCIAEEHSSEMSVSHLRNSNLLCT